MYSLTFLSMGRAALAAMMFVAASAAPAASQAPAFETRAETAYVVDAGTGTVLFSKNPDLVIPPASLAKLMTVEFVFNAIQQRDLSLDDEFVVSEHAWRTGGAPSRTSTMFAALGSSIRVEDLLRGLIVQAANDGAIILAEGIAGSEAAFADQLNQRAREIGLSHSVFVNPTGLPAPGQTTTMRDMVRLAVHLGRSYPDLYGMFAETDFTWNNIFQRNRNPLLTLNGAEGLGIGYTEGVGFSIVGAVQRDGRRTVLALGGIATDTQRADEARRVVDWSFRAFETQPLFDEGEIVGQAKLFGASKSSLALKANGPVSILIPIDSRDRIAARIIYEGPVKSPVEEGTRIGHLQVRIGDAVAQQTPLYAAESIDRGTMRQRALDSILELLTGWIRLL